MFLKIMKLYNEAVAEATNNAYENVGNRYSKVLSGGISGLIDTYLNEFSVEELKENADKINEYAASGKMRQKFDDFFATYSPTDLQNDLADVVAGLGEEVNAYQVAVLVKRVPDVLPLQQLVEVAQKIAENMPEDTAEQQQQKMMMSMAAPMIIAEKVAPVYQMIEQASVPEIATMVQQISAQGSALVSQNTQGITEFYGVMQAAAYGMVEGAEQSKSADNALTLREMQTTLSKAFKEYASKDAAVSANAFGPEFKEKFKTLAKKMDSSNDNVGRSASGIVKKFKL